jgi:hypothetical protein
VAVLAKEIETLARHKTITMSARYAHLSPDAASASERMSRIEYQLRNRIYTHRGIN